MLTEMDGKQIYGLCQDDHSRNPGKSILMFLILIFLSFQGVSIKLIVHIMNIRRTS